MKPTPLLTFFLYLAVASTLVTAARAAQQSRAERIILPKIVLNNAPIKIAVRFLIVNSLELDPDKKGVTIALTGPEDNMTRISLDLANISVADAAKKVAEAGNLEMRTDGENIVLKSRAASPAPGAPASATPIPTQIPGLAPIPK